MYNNLTLSTLRRLFTFIVFIFSVFRLEAQDLKTYMYQGVFEEIGDYYQYIEDCGGLNPTEVLKQFEGGNFQKFQGTSRAFNMGMTPCSYWLVMAVQNDWERDRRLLWSFFNDGLEVTYYELLDGALEELITTSLHESLLGRPFPSRGISYPFYLEKDQRRVFFAKVKPSVNGHVYFPTEMNDVADYFIWEIDFTYLFGKLSGVFFFAIFVNLCFFIILRQWIYVHHLFYICFVLLFLLSDFHFNAFQFSGRTFEALSYVNKGAIISMILFFYSKVFRKFTNLDTVFPRMGLILKMGNLIFISMAVISLFVSYYFHDDTVVSYYFSWIINTVNNLGFGLLISAIFFGIFKGERFFKLYGVTSLFLLYGFAAFLLNTFDILFLPIIRPGNIITGLVIEVSLLTVFLIYKYRVEREESAELVMAEMKRNEALSVRMIDIQEEERSRIAKDVHDEVANDVVALQLYLQNAVAQDAERSANQSMVLKKLRTLHKKIRNVSHDLMPLASEGAMVDSIRELIAFYDNNSETKFSFYSNIERGNTIPKKIQLHVVRLVKEILSNAIKYADASTITVQVLLVDGDISLSIEDDGVGFDTSRQFEGKGLRNVASRVEFLNGELNLDSSSAGTNYLIEIPLGD